MRTVVRRNFRHVGFDSERPVSLADYWTAVRDGIDPDDRFREMCAFLEQVGRNGGGREGAERGDP